MFADPHFQAREAIIEVETERFGKLKMQNVVPRLSATPSSVRTPAPSEVGQHNAEIYGDLLGLDETQRQALAARGII
jgi:formyl-CoA transferase